jgi:hypothetical protein
MSAAKFGLAAAGRRCRRERRKAEEQRDHRHAKVLAGDDSPVCELLNPWVAELDHDVVCDGRDIGFVREGAHDAAKGPPTVGPADGAERMGLKGVVDRARRARSRSASGSAQFGVA